jgi:hypothetical protein
MAKIRPVQLVGLAALLIPAAYIWGRYAVNLSLQGPLELIIPGLAATSLGALIGIPIGLFFGSAKNPTPPAPIHTHPNMTKQQDKILEQLREELIQNKNLFEARKGNQSFLTRISYLTGFWTAAKSSGQLFVMQEPKLLHTLATAYYTAVINNHNATTHLIAEARLLDGPLGVAVQSAIDAINNQLAADRAATTSPGASVPAPYSVGRK